MRRATALAVPVRTLALSWSISSHFVAVHPSIVHCSRKSQKTLKHSILKTQGHLRLLMLLPLKSSSSVLVMINSISICLSATVFMLDEPISAKITTFGGVPLLVARVRRSPYM